MRQSKRECCKTQWHETWHRIVNCGTFYLAPHNQFKYMDYQLFLLLTLVYQSSLRRLDFASLMGVFSLVLVV